MKICIVLMKDRFVSVGVFSETETHVILDNAAVVRYWGTERGLGQIAADGPTKNTVLDKTPRESIPKHAIIKMIDCDVKAWKKVLEVK